MAEKIGLDAVLDMQAFDRGLSHYLSGIRSMESATGSAANTISRGFGFAGTSAIALGTAIGNLAAAAIKEVLAVEAAV